MAALPRLLLSFFFVVISILVSADNHGVTFLFPIDGFTISHNDTVNVTYTSNFPIPLLYTFCKTENKLIQESRENSPAYNGSQLVQLRWPNITSCYWDLRPNTSAGYGANSPSINVLAKERAEPSTIGLAQVTATSTGTATSGDTSSDGTPSSSSSPSSSSGLSTGAKAGIGIGVALVVILGAAVAGFFILRRRKAKRAISASYPMETKTHDQSNGLGNSSQKGYQEVPNVNVTHEMEGEGEERNELPTAGHEVRYELRG